MRLLVIGLWPLLLLNVILWMFADVEHHTVIAIGWLLIFPVTPLLLPDTDPWRNVR